MTVKSNEYWPFPVNEEGKQWPEMIEKITFLEEVTASGFKGFRSGNNDYGAESATREGIIIERGRDRWEFRLSVSGDRRFSAFVCGFAIAGNALLSWLNGASENDVFSDVKDALVILPGASASYTISKKVDATEAIASKP